MSMAVGDTVGRGGTTADCLFAAAVVGYGMLLARSENLGEFTWERCLELACVGRGTDTGGYRAEL